jgi:hypothetical protein
MADKSQLPTPWAGPYIRGPAPAQLEGIKSERLLRRTVLSALQRDFKNRCCYCTGNIYEKGGIEHFEVEHFRPKGLKEFSHLSLEYNNLYLSCRGCNLAKGDEWPNPVTLEQRFIDPCEEAIYPTYLEVGQNGQVSPRQSPGAYLFNVFKFGQRPSIRKLWRVRELLSKLQSAIQNKDLASAQAALEIVDDLIGS